MKPFQPDDSFQRKRGTLPHWTQDGVIYFVTFRLADSIPEAALAEWKNDRNEWLICQGVSPHEFSYDDLSLDQRKYYGRNFGRRFHQLLDDCFGECVLRDRANGQIVADALRFFAGERYRLESFVVMPNHAHVQIQPEDGFTLSKIMQSVKSHSAKEINRRMGRSGQLWQRESYDHIVRSEKQLEFYRGYIADNPEKAKLRGGFVLSE